MLAKIQAYTQHPDMGPEDFIAYCARVSNPSNQMNHETNDRLLAYLMRHSHWSPFEMVSVTMEINTTRDIARQILRHKSFSFQEFSQRYADASEIGFIHNRETRLQDFKNRQNSVDSDDIDLQSWWEEAQYDIAFAVQEIYAEALQRGIAKEQARAILPEGLTKSRLYMAGTLRSWIHYIDLRASNGTQKEHMQIAEACRAELKKVFPRLF